MMTMSMVISQNKKLGGGNEKANRSHLPDPVLFDEILTRLPAKTLLHFKSVSKHWYSTIRSPYFSRVHHSRAQTRPDGVSLAISMAMPKGRSFETNLFTAGYEGGPASHLLSSHEYNCSILTHGLILLSHKDMCKVSRPVFIYNPTTKELVSLPPISKYTAELCYDSICADYSFRYDPLTGQYKVLAMCTSYNMDEVVEEKYCLFIFTLGTESWTWRKLGITFPRPSRIVSSSACCVNGAIHWLVHYPDGNIIDGFEFILAFDVGKEQFKKLSLFGRPAYLGILKKIGDRLAMCGFELDDYRVPEVWVLEGYDKGEWMKVKIENPLTLNDEAGLFEVRAIRSGEKFLVTPRRKEMVEFLWGCYCDKNGKECSAFNVTGLPVDIEFLHTSVGLKMLKNVETLFSPRAGLASNNSADSECSMFGLYLH